jgi:hypothetical protein
MHGWVYDFERGKVTVYDPLKNQFVPLAESIRDKMLRDAGPQPGATLGMGNAGVEASEDVGPWSFDESPRLQARSM